MVGGMGRTGGLTNPPPLARKKPSRLFKYRWAFLALKEGAFSKKKIAIVCFFTEQLEKNLKDLRHRLRDLNGTLKQFSFMLIVNGLSSNLFRVSFLFFFTSHTIIVLFFFQNVEQPPGVGVSAQI